MPRLNWTIILSNITDAREQLEELEARRQNGERITEVEYQVMIQHAYHHLNFAWNARHQPTVRYKHLTKQDFQRWGKLPKDLDFI